MIMKMNIAAKIFYMVIVISITLTNSALATKYYVDYQNGNDNFNGMSILTPFKHSPADPNASGIPATITLQPGDTVVFKGGVRYLSTINLNNLKGNSSNYIVFAGNSGWGTGQAIFDGEATRNIIFSGSSAEYIKITGIKFTNWATGAGWKAVVYQGNLSKHWIIDSCQFVYPAGWNQYQTWETYNMSIAFGVGGEKATYGTVSNCLFIGSGRQAISVRNADSVFIYNNNFGGYGLGLNSDSTGWFSTAITVNVNGSVNHLRIYDNILYNGWQYGGDTSPETMHSPHWIFVRGNTAPGVRDVIIERNKLINDKYFAYGTGSGMISAMTNIHNLHIRNNLLVNPCAYWGFGMLAGSSAGTEDSIYVYNNTIIGRSYSTNATPGYLLHRDGRSSNIKWYNNLIFSDDVDDWFLLRSFNADPSISDYNAFISSQNETAVLFLDESGNTLSSIRTITGKETNSQFISSVNGVFNNLPSSPANSSTGDYSLSSSAPEFLKTGGLDLSTIFSGFNTDINGNTRTGGWSIGAYEYSNQTTGDLIPPEVISATLLDSVTLNIVFSEPLEQSGAENPSNYQIDNNIQINSALLLGNTVRLQTSIHSPGFYSVVVNNVTDTAGNVISAQNNTANYGYNPDPLPGILKFTPTGTNASSIPEPDHLPEKTFDGLGYNSGDPTSRWAGNNLPQWIGYDLGNSIMLSKTRIQFYKWNEGRIYNYSIMVSTDSINWTTVKQNILSSNTEWTEENFEPIPARYVRIVVHSNNQNNWASLWETEFYGQLIVSGNEDNNIIPSNFALEQNYPNPFNPVTKIRYTIPGNVEARRGVSLRVYDILGNEVATLVDEYKEPGIYEVEFDAADLASGVYIYRLQADGYLNTRKMILLR